MERIKVIDALRGAILLGILIVHVNSLYGFNIATNEVCFTSPIDVFLKYSIYWGLSGRLSAIFSILFGVSFHLILKKESYSTIKFIWRCTILVIIGIAVKVFYTYDALMWYGLWGILLTVFRNRSNRILYVSFFSFLFLSTLLSYFSIGDFIFGPIDSERYIISDGLSSILSYPILSYCLLRSIFRLSLMTVFLRP